MENFLYFIRDNLVGIHYFIYDFILLFFMFSIIGYLFKQKYAKFYIKLNTSQEVIKDEKKDTSKEKNTKNEVAKKETKVKKEIPKVENVNKEVVNKPIVSPKVNYTTSIKEIEQETKETDNKSMTVPAFQVNQMTPQVGIPLPTTTDVKKAVPLPTKPEDIIATKLVKEVNETPISKANEPIPELK